MFDGCSVLFQQEVTRVKMAAVAMTPANQEEDDGVVPSLRRVPSLSDLSEEGSLGECHPPLANMTRLVASLVQLL